MSYSRFLFCVSALILPQISRGESLALTFAAKSYEISKDDLTSISTLAQSSKQDKKHIVKVQERTFEQRSSSLSYIIEKNRALRIFQELVRQGVDPACIEYVQVKPAKADEALVIEVATVESEHQTMAIVPSADPSRAEAENFTVNFPSGSAVPASLNAESLKSFLTSVGQPGRDAVVIEGYTDTVGNPAYNQALGDLRALSVYELLVRAGLPPYRVDTQSQGAGKAAGKGESAADRRVVVRWTKNLAIAQEAAKQEAPPAAPPPVEKPIEPVEKPLPAAEPAPKEEPAPARTIDIVPFAGLIQPTGEFRSHVKPSLTFGLGVGKTFWSHGDTFVRATLFGSNKSTFKAKESDRSGDVNIRTLSLQTDFVSDHKESRPYIGLKLGVVRWQGEITQPSTDRSHSKSVNDTEISLALGMDYILKENLAFAPQLEWNRVDGAFNANLISVLFIIRWSI